MKSVLLLVFSLFLSASLFAQLFESGNTGEAILRLTKSSGGLPKNMNNVPGSFLPEFICTASLKTTDGAVFKSVNGHIDLISNNFIITTKEEDYVCTLPVLQIVFDSCDAKLQGAVFESGYPAIYQQTSKSFYRVLAAGKATLLKYYSFTPPDANKGGYAIVSGNNPLIEEYYLYTDWHMYKLDKSKSKLTEIFTSPAVKEYMTTQKLKLRNEEDAIKLVAYYNSLQ
ncbi:MAG: hypothetical protein JWN76_3089 [Chitinophagaceae bacterium]|nr:hypothetical protein [Chitinophagaceae bacterium]